MDCEACGPAVPDAPREPVSVLVANFKNDANEELFDGLVEQAIAVGIEGSPVPDGVIPAATRCASGRR